MERKNNQGQSAKDLIFARGLKPKKSFGQNFMLDQRINKIFVDALKTISPQALVVEIGVGTGSLTSHLLDAGYNVHGIERDRDLIPILKEQFQEALALAKFTLHEADGARFDLSLIAKPARLAVLVGNLPYHLTSSIIFLTLKHIEELLGAVFLVQKEVADRLVAKENCKEYGFLTVVLALLFRVEKVAMVGRNAFWPVPKVDSAIIKLQKLPNENEKVANLEDFIVFVRGIFQQRRKKISTILKGKLSAEQILQAGVDPNLRPEQLAPKKFLDLFKAQ